ncbi:hypothetical protein BpHYR1_053379 [Brachionus plicatilis]|uniref:Uncharacterized protein n=1 Tax=Brachionus plicatilis TaxID=10195 RepID=A0A3M7P341_BRAPC|nr:hypothetical protein BpHYR1_053379 [Brachionus plicatilis]
MSKVFVLVNVINRKIRFFFDQKKSRLEPNFIARITDIYDKFNLRCINSIQHPVETICIKCNKNR